PLSLGDATAGGALPPAARARPHASPGRSTGKASGARKRELTGGESGAGQAAGCCTGAGEAAGCCTGSREGGATGEGGGSGAGGGEEGGCGRAEAGGGCGARGGDAQRGPQARPRAATTARACGDQAPTGGLVSKGAPTREALAHPAARRRATRARRFGSPA